MAKQALDGKRFNGFRMDPNELVIVGLDTDDSSDSSELWDERIFQPVSENLIRNIMRRGVLSPVVVRKNGPRVEVVDGRQRVRAARDANVRLLDEGSVATILVPCIVDRYGAGDALGVMITLNENRLDDNPMVRAQKAQRLLKFDRNLEDVANDFSVTVQGLKNMLALLDLGPAVQKLVRERKLAQSLAVTLLDLTHDEQEKKALEWIEAGAVTVEEGKRQRKERENGGADPEPVRTKPPSRTVLRKVAENEEFVAELSPDAQAILRWVLGDHSAVRRIKGLTALLKE